MLYNMDRNLQTNLLRLYKTEAEEHELRRYREKQRQIKEDKEFLFQREKKENEAEDKIRLDKIRLINKNMDSYHEMLQNLPMKRKSRIEDVKINNYGYNIVGGPPINQIRTLSVEPQPNYSFDKASVLSYPQREIDIIRRRDKLGNFLTENVNEGELKSYFQNQKNEQVKYYKELLDTQCSKNQTSPQPSSWLNIQNANIIKNYKRYTLPEDPYNWKRNSPIGLSKLDHNPILNPVNHPGYNKYINISNSIQEQKLFLKNTNMPKPDQIQRWQIDPLKLNDHIITQHQHSIPRDNRENYSHSTQNQFNNNYRQDCLPFNTNQRLIQAGALSFNK